VIGSASFAVNNMTSAPSLVQIGNLKIRIYVDAGAHRDGVVSCQACRLVLSQEREVGQTVCLLLLHIARMCPGPFDWLLYLK
jgi:hypothetical protein